jgi:hypothetical protein
VSNLADQVRGILRVLTDGHDTPKVLKVKWVEGSTPQSNLDAEATPSCIEITSHGLMPAVLLNVRGHGLDAILQVVGMTSTEFAAKRQLSNAPPVFTLLRFDDGFVVDSIGI